MSLDIRIPIGLMFGLIGAILAVFGLVSGERSMSLDINVNLIWGCVLLVFGALMLVMAYRASKRGSK